MTMDVQGIVEARSKFGYQAPHYLQKEYAEGLEFTPNQPFKSSTHLGITIQRAGSRFPSWVAVGEVTGSC